MDLRQFQSSAGNVLELIGLLERALADEAEALRNLDVDGLQLAVADKQESLRRLTTELARSGLDRVIQGQIAVSDNGSGAADTLRRTLVERLRQCRAMNDTAGGAIASLRQTTREALGLLGMAAEPENYGQSGHGTAPTGGRSLAVG